MVAARQIEAEVSIHIRHCWRMNWQVNRIAKAAAAVSIHIRHCWRMNWGEVNPAERSIDVSIHIRHCWRMNSKKTMAGQHSQLVSIHIRHCWRMNSRPGGGKTDRGSFNPHSPLLANELVLAVSRCRVCCVFQSTFAIAGE